MKLNSRRKVFLTYGAELLIRDHKGKNYKLDLKSSLVRINKFNIRKVLPYESFYRNIRTKDPFEEKCSACGSTEGVEMHHRRPLKSGKTDNTLKGIEKNLSRRQIPLCSECHQKVHAGKYDGPGIY